MRSARRRRSSRLSKSSSDNLSEYDSDSKPGIRFVNRLWTDSSLSIKPICVSRQAQRAIHQLRLNRLSSTASYQALIGQIESPTCPHCGNGDEMAEHLLLLCPKWAVEHQRYFGDSIDIKDVFQDYESLVEFLISSGHLSLHIGSTWRARHDNSNNNNNKFKSQQFFFESAALSKWNWLCSSPVQHCYALPCYTVMWIITGHLCWWAAHVKIM